MKSQPWPLKGTCEQPVDLMEVCSLMVQSIMSVSVYELGGGTPLTTQCPVAFAVPPAGQDGHVKEYYNEKGASQIASGDHGRSLSG